jgi:SAM-dependent methyltransferase
MDMRMLEFPDQSFDFCYSSCAIEHIGGHDDFVRHLREVRRVLRDQGVYVLTTEFHYGPDVLPYPNNYYFSAAALGELVAEGGLACAGEVDARVARHAVNHPLPAAVGDLLPQDDFARDLLGSPAGIRSRRFVWC